MVRTIISIFIIMPLFFAISCKQQTNTDQKIVENSDSLETLILEFTNKYNAKDVLDSEIYFTIDVQEKFNDPKSLFLIKGMIYDIEKKEGDVYLHIINESSFLVKILFILKLKAKNNYNLDFLQDIVLIAKIDEIKKASFKISAEPISSEEADIMIDTFEKLVIVKGECIDYL